MVEYELVPLVPNGQTASDDSFHNEHMRTPAFGIIDHIM
jgi:hypothetical protein